LSQYQIGQQCAPTVTDSPDKAGTPTMGGALILVAIAVATLLRSDLVNRYV